MSQRVVLEDLALTPDGPTVNLDLAGGHSLAIVGRAASGKSHLVDVISGETSPKRGSCRLAGTLKLARDDVAGRRAKPADVASGRGAGAATRAAEALSATHLWDDRNANITDLSPMQRRAVALLPVLASDAKVLLIDGLLDGLNIWVQASVLELLRERQTAGQAVIVATGDARVAASMDALILLDKSRIRFAGSPEELQRAAGVNRIEVHTDSRSAVSALVAPFEVTVSEEPYGLKFEALEGQALAAKMLLEGYGDVKFVVVAQVTIEAALRTLI
jgi:ABC-type multidrug transport system ATPase subunit